jgi:hypothetical protein
MQTRSRLQVPITLRVWLVKAARLRGRSARGGKSHIPALPTYVDYSKALWQLW